MKSNIMDMKAPDKVYIRSRAFETPSPAYIDENANYGGEQYIRKDALLERLEKVAAEYKKRSDEGELVWQNMCGINEAIGILNEM